MLNWLEERTGFVSMTKTFLTEDVPGGASYWYVFGSATLFAMILQISTGIFLTFWYAPSAATAWESTRAIYLNPFERFVLSMHYWGATAMIALVCLHLLQVAIFGAYKRPRELQWVVGVLLLLVTLVLGLTGYLLPWDMDAYFASQVSLNITGTAPIAGPLIQSIAQGGNVMGTETINRFFGLHVWLMPALLLLLVGAHLAIFRHNGPAGPVVDDRRGLKSGRFWPDQLFMDTVVSFFVFLLIVFLSFVAPPFLDQKADPTVLFQPYPAWYFLALFGLLHLFPPQLDTVATIYIPTLFLIVVLLIPWIDRGYARSFGTRRGVVASIVIVAVVLVVLSIQSQMNIVALQAQNPHLSEAQVLAAAQPATTTARAAAGAQAPGAAAAVGSSAVTTSSSGHGATVFGQNCSSCHGAQGQGTPGVFPPLANNPTVTGDPAKVILIVRNGLTGSISVNGQTYNGTMPAWKSQLSAGDIADVITYIRSSLGSNHASAVVPSQVTSSK
jgi:ubiquinol-cytochrome c reductase cytochrome b subunit